MKYLILVLLLSVGCNSAPAPVPPPMEEPPPVVDPGPPALSHAGESGWLRVEGYRLLTEGGDPYTVRSMTDFFLLRRYCATIRGTSGTPHIDLDAHLTERISHGAKMLRVLGMAHYLERFNPAEVQDYWGCLSEFADHLARRGLRFEYVVFADAPEVMPNKTAQLAHFEGAVNTLAAHWNAVGELCNECPKNLTNWKDFPRPTTQTLWSRGSGLGDAQPPSPGWSWFGWHGRRDHPKVWISAEDMWFVTRGIDGSTGRVINPPMVGWADEMIGFDEVEQPGRRSADCELAVTLAYASKAFGSGGTFHSEAGLWSRPLGPKQAQCARAFFEALL